MKVFVTGASGFVGSRLVPALVEAGHEVSVLTRDATRYQGVPEVQVVEGDLLEPGSFRLGDTSGTLGEVLSTLGVEAAYYLVHSMGAGEGFETKDRTAARTFTRGVSDAEVGRVVYLGGLGSDRDLLSPHLQSRREVELILAEGDAELTTLRAAIIIGDGSASFELIRQLSSRLPVMVTPRWVETPCQPISVDDVVAYLVGVLDVPETSGETYEIGGPEVLTYREILRQTGRQLGQAPYIISVPVLTPRLSAYWLDLVTDVPRGVAHPLIEGLKNPVVATDTRIRELIDVDLTPFDVAVAEALGRSSREQPVSVSVDSPDEHVAASESDAESEPETETETDTGTETELR